MKNKKFKLTFLGAALCFALVGCSNDDSVDGTNNNSESGVVSNGEITLTYGSSLLDHYVNILNKPLNLNGGSSARSTNHVENYSNFINGLNLSPATDLQANHSTNIDQAGVYRIPSGVIFTGNFNVNNSNVTLIVDGVINGNINLNGTRVIVTENGEVTSTSTLRFNNNSSLYNWGVVNFTDSTINGTVRNNNLINFKNQITFNSGATVTNNCKIIFENKATFNTPLTNNAFVKFENGFLINSNGTMFLKSGSYTKVTGGEISYNDLIQGVDPVTSPLARLDILTPTTLGTINGTNRITGVIDVNTNFSATVLKASNSVLFNQNTFVGASDCTEAAGMSSSGCSITDLKTNIIHFAEITSPEINGQKLSATDVKVINNKAYVSYHTNEAYENNGNFPYGSVRVFELNETARTLNLETQANFTNCEFNALEVDDNNIYAIGSNLDGGRMYTAPLDANKLFAVNLNAVWSYKFTTAGGKSIALDGTNLWVAAGNTGGGLFKFTPNGNSYESSPLITKDGAKYVVKKGDKQIFFALDNGKPYIRISDMSGSVIAEKTDSNITVQTRNGKNAISVDDNYIYVALSDQGVAKYNLTDGTFVAKFVPSEFRPFGPKLFNKNGLTNAVTVDNCFVYVANGADGVIILNKSDLSYVSHFNTKLNASVNYVYASGNYLFVATGRDGLDIIKIK